MLAAKARDGDNVLSDATVPEASTSYACSSLTNTRQHVKANCCGRLAGASINWAHTAGKPWLHRALLGGAVVLAAALGGRPLAARADSMPPEAVVATSVAQDKAGEAAAVDDLGAHQSNTWQVTCIVLTPRIHVKRSVHHV